MTAAGSTGMSDQQIREIVYRTTTALDLEDFDAFMALCAPDLDYRITAYSPEIRKEMIWLDQDYEGMRALLDMVPQHLRRLGSLKRHVSVYFIERNADDTAAVTSSFLVTHTTPEGQSSLFVAGTYFDVIDLAAGKLKQRRAHLETRDLGIGSHIPI